MKKILIKLSILLNIILICFIIIKTNPSTKALDGTYVSNIERKSSYSISFDKEKHLYVLYKNGELVEVNSFNDTNRKNIYTIEGNDLNKYLIVDNKSFYFQVSKGQFIKFTWDTNGMTFLGEVPKEYKDKN